MAPQRETERESIQKPRGLLIQGWYYSILGGPNDGTQIPKAYHVLPILLRFLLLSQARRSMSSLPSRAGLNEAGFWSQNWSIFIGKRCSKSEVEGGNDSNDPGKTEERKNHAFFEAAARNIAVRRAPWHPENTGRHDVGKAVENHIFAGMCVMCAADCIMSCLNFDRIRIRSQKWTAKFCGCMMPLPSNYSILTCLIAARYLNLLQSIFDFTLR